jgi:pimeloyl-ACP methyl ester carboxylesterase
MPTTRLDHVVAPDGVRIAYWTSGHGRPLVMVHGSMADHSTLDRVRPLLEPHFTVHAVDRRGRGASGDGHSYTLDREIWDVTTVVDDIAQRTRGPVWLYGHSFGATCALGAALRTSSIGRLVLYEPAYRGIFDYPAGFINRLATLIHDGHPDQAVQVVMRERVGVTAAQLEALQAAPSWPARVAAAPAIPRELSIDATLDFDPTPYLTMTTPTVLLLGEHSPAGQQRILTAIDAALPDSSIVTLPGQEHMAQMTAPHLIADALIRELTPAAMAP